LTGDTTGKEIKAIDRATGNPIPASDLTITFENPTGGTVAGVNDFEVRNGKLYINRVGNGTPNVKAKVIYQGNPVGTVMITNSDLSSNQNTTYELKVPDYAMYLSIIPTNMTK